MQLVMGHNNSRQIHANPKGFQPGSTLFVVTEQSHNKFDVEGDEEAPKSSSATTGITASCSITSSSSSETKELEEDQEIPTRRSREKAELERALGGFREAEREKVKLSNTRNLTSSTRASNRQLSKSEHCGEIDRSRRRSSGTRKSYIVNQKVLYINHNGDAQSATILKVNWDHNHYPFYDIRLHISGTDEQTDGSHLADLPSCKKSKSSNRAMKNHRRNTTTRSPSFTESSTRSPQGRRQSRQRRHRSHVGSDLSEDRKSRSNPELTRPPSTDLPPEHSESSDNVVWDGARTTPSFPKRVSSLPIRASYHYPKACSSPPKRAASLPKTADPPATPENATKTLERRLHLRSPHSSPMAMSWSRQSVDSYRTPRRGRVIRTRSMNIDNYRLSLIEQNATARHLPNIGSLRMVVSAEQKSMKEPLLSPTSVTHAPTRHSWGGQPGTETIGILSPEKQSVAAQFLPAQWQAVSSSSQSKVDEMASPQAVKKQSKPFLSPLWKKTKSISSSLPRQPKEM